MSWLRENWACHEFLKKMSKIVKARKFLIQLQSSIQYLSGLFFRLTVLPLSEHNLDITITVNYTDTFRNFFQDIVTQFFVINSYNRYRNFSLNSTEKFVIVRNFLVTFINNNNKVITQKKNFNHHNIRPYVSFLLLLLLLRKSYKIIIM